MFPLLAQLIFHAPKHDWQFIDNKYWQIVSMESSSKDISLGHCPPGMIFIDGNMLDDSKTPDNISSLQNTVCDKWDFLGTKNKKCISYNESAWKNITKKLSIKHLSYCIDKYEYPNKVGLYPAVLIDWNDANKICKSESKRLCTEDEFTFACEGTQAKPYPYGYTLNNSKCNTNNKYISYKASELLTKKPYIELDNLWQGKTIGDNTECVSDFGVYDLIGNMEEWSTKSRSSQYESVLKSGYWVSPGVKCRSSIRSHGPYHKFYQLGFRCCKDYK